MGSKGKRVPKWVWSVARAALAAGILAVLVLLGKLDFAVIGQMRHRPLLAIVGIGLLITAVLLSIGRWYLLLVVQEIRPGLWEAARLTLIGFFWSTVIPGSVSGDIVKAYYVAHHTDKKARAATTVILDRVVGVVTMLICATVAIAVVYWNRQVEPIAGIPPAKQARVWAVGLAAASLLVLLAAFFALCLSVRAGRWRWMTWLRERAPLHQTISEIYAAVHAHRQRRGLAAGVVALSFLGQMPLFIGHICIARALGVSELTLGAYFFAVPVGLLVNSIPLTPMGLGVGQVGFGWLFDLFGSHKGAELITVVHACFLGVALVGMVLYARGKREIDAAAREAREKPA